MGGATEWVSEGGREDSASHVLTCMIVHGWCRGKWSSASKEEVEAEMAKGTPYCYRFRVPPNKVRSAAHYMQAYQTQQPV